LSFHIKVQQGDADRAGGHQKTGYAWHGSDDSWGRLYHGVYGKITRWHGSVRVRIYNNYGRMVYDVHGVYGTMALGVR
jgi:hypothetical protein